MLSASPPKTPPHPLPAHIASHVIEPDEQWKADLRKRIERDLKHMVEEARTVRDAILNSRPPESSRARARREYEESMNNIRSLAQEQFISQLRLEMSERKWVLDLIASSDSPEVVRHQKWILDNIHKPDEERTPFLPQDASPNSEGGLYISPQPQGDSEQGSYESFEEGYESGGFDDRPGEPTGEEEEEEEEAADLAQENWAQEEAIAEHQTAESSRIEAEVTTSLEGEEATDAEATNPAIEDSACHTQETERTAAPEQVRPIKAQGWEGSKETKRWKEKEKRCEEMLQRERGPDEEPRRQEQAGLDREATLERERRQLEANEIEANRLLGERWRAAEQKKGFGRREKQYYQPIVEREHQNSIGASLHAHRPNRETGSVGNGSRKFSTFSSYAALLSSSRPTSTSRSRSINPSFLSSSISFTTTQRPSPTNSRPDALGTSLYAAQGIETNTRQAEGSVEMRDAAAPEEADASRKAAEAKKPEAEAQMREARGLAQEIEARREEARHLEERARQFLEEAKRLEASARRAEVSARVREVGAQKNESEATRKQAEAKERGEEALMRETKSQRKEEEVRHREDAAHHLQMKTRQIQEGARQVEAFSEMHETAVQQKEVEVGRRGAEAKKLEMDAKHGEAEAPHKDEMMSKRENKAHFEKAETQNHEEKLRKFEKYIQGREADIEERLRVIDERSRVISLQEDDLQQRLAAVREHEEKLRVTEAALREMEMENFKLRNHINRKPESNLPPQTSLAAMRTLPDVSTMTLPSRVTSS